MILVSVSWFISRLWSVVHRTLQHRMSSAIEHSVSCDTVCVDAPAVAAGVGAGGGLLYAAGGVPYTYHNGLAMFNPVLQTQQAAAAAAAAAFPDGYALSALPQMVSSSIYVLYLYTVLEFVHSFVCRPTVTLDPSTETVSLGVTQWSKCWERLWRGGDSVVPGYNLSGTKYSEV